jgi:hypothetical protein
MLTDLNLVEEIFHSLRPLLQSALSSHERKQLPSDHLPLLLHLLLLYVY